MPDLSQTFFGVALWLWLTGALVVVADGKPARRFDQAKRAEALFNANICSSD